MTEEKYYFKDFTRRNYRELLKLAKSKFRFKGYDEIKNKENQSILWRHDVDFSMHSALALAKIEYEEGVTSTFFLMAHCEFYNLLEKEISQIVLKIRDFGHDVGIHFDSHYYEIEDESDIEKHLKKEFSLFESMFQISPTAFSFHNTTPFTMSCEKEEYYGLTNAYSSFFKTELDYCSDSNGYWRYNRLLDFLNTPRSKNVQVLTHPAWWQDDVMSPFDRIKRSVKGRHDKVLNDYTAALEKGGVKNVL